MVAAIDLTGRRVGILTVLDKSNNRTEGKNEILWNCICDCGNTKEIRSSSLSKEHTKSCGCLKTVKGRGLVPETVWLDRFVKEHGDRYTYENSKFLGNTNKIDITCKKHGSFMMLPNDHWNGHGCKECRKELLSNKFMMTKDDFISKAKALNGDKFCYDNVEYKGYHKLVSITCEIHGDFEQTPNSHLNGNGCKFCSGKSGDSVIYFQKFLSDCKIKFGDKYDYSKVRYVNSAEKVLIVCPTHGDMLQTPSSHLSSDTGCKHCGNELKAEKLLSSREYFIHKCNMTHGGLYDYSKVVYTGKKNKVEVICKHHGSFFTNAGNHSQGSGCPSCTTSGFSTTEDGFLYILKSGDITKVGITNKTPMSRCTDVSNSSGHEFIVNSSYYFKNGLQRSNVETEILRFLRKSHKNPVIKFAGYSECFFDVNIDELRDRIDNVMKGIYEQ